MENKPNPIGERLGTLIDTLKLSKGEFAEKADISQSLISNILKGNNGPSRATVNLICNTYHVNKSWLRTGNGEMFAKKPDLPSIPTIGPDGELLKEDEAELLATYRKLEKETQEKALVYAHDMLKAQGGPVSLEKGANEKAG